MSYTEVTTTSWFSRLGGSLKGIVLGVLLVLASFPVLFWNEGRAVHQAQALAEGRQAVTSVAADRVDPSMEGRLVHLSGLAVPEGPVLDAEFGVQVSEALRLRRVVEMYQWRQESHKKKRKQAGGSEKTVTTYTYHLDWSPRLIDSSSFKQSGHQNPTRMPYQASEFGAGTVGLGAFVLGPELVTRLSGWTDLRVSSGQPQSLSGRLKAFEGGFYQGQDPTRPQLGDVRIRYQYVPAGEVSLVAVQAGATFKGFPTRAGGEILEVVSGRRTADEMFRQLETTNSMLTWFLRGLGTFLAFTGLALVLRPLSVMADVAPVFGNLVGCGSVLVALGLALPLSLVVMAVAWITYRPLVGGGLLLLGLLGLVAAIAHLRRRRA